MEEDYCKILTDYIGISAETPEEYNIRKNKEAIEVAKSLAEKYKWNNPDKIDMSYDKTKISPYVKVIVNKLHKIDKLIKIITIMDLTLEESLIRDGATLISTIKTATTFICKCGTTHTKPQKAICLTSGAYCKDCTQRNTAIKKIKNKIALNDKLLAKQ